MAKGYTEKNAGWLKVRTRTGSDLRGKARVYFSAHPKDLHIYMDEVCRDIFASQDCAVYYNDDLLGTYTYEEWDMDLSQMSLLAIPVTERLLKEKSRTLDTDLPLALEKGIPVLPVLMEEVPDELYTSCFGKLQYLSAVQTKNASISYEEKLKGYLSRTLVDNELRDKIIREFDAYIFLSYRKQDRKHAGELMRLIHKEPKYRDIAVWYDEFLNPGEDFDENIDEALKKSSLFVLLVTPALLEDPNYVKDTEYPAAVAYNKKILAVEMEDTDKEELKEKYPGLSHIINGRDEEAFARVLAEALKDIAISKNDTDPEHIFLVGMAYLEGIDVEKDTGRGLELIMKAAQSKLPDALGRMATIINGGTGFKDDLQKDLQEGAGQLVKGFMSALDGFTGLINKSLE